MIAATPMDSEERFRARVLWPSLAKRLRAVAEAAPVVAALVTGSADRESTLSSQYGGKAEAGKAAVRSTAPYRAVPHHVGCVCVCVCAREREGGGGRGRGGRLGTGRGPWRL